MNRFALSTRAIPMPKLFFILIGFVLAACSTMRAQHSLPFYRCSNLALNVLPWAVWKDANACLMAQDSMPKKRKALAHAKHQEQTASTATTDASKTITMRRVQPRSTVKEPLKSYVTVSGVAVDSSTENVLEEVSIVVYEQLPDEKEIVFVSEKFLDGQIRFPLQRGRNYRVVVEKTGFATQSIHIASEDVADKNEVEKNFFLQVASTPKPTTKFKTTYALTHATSLREGASHESRVLLRFADGNKVQVLENNHPLWWKVRYSGKTGYVKAALLQPVE